MRKQTKPIKVGNLIIGGGHDIIIQSMTTTRTSDVEKTVDQIKYLEESGCQLIRVAVLDMNDALALGAIKKQIKIPLVADIHFMHQLALEAINQGVDKIRINPGNITDPKLVKQIVIACQEKNIPIRIGVNSGSLPNNLLPTPKNMVDVALDHIKILEDLNFYNMIVSLKATDMKTMVESYLLASKTFDYPLHLGVTEAGTAFSGSIKSAMGIGIVLYEGVGDTIRVSLTDDPKLEIRAAKEILKNLKLISNVPDLISCPTCGRLQYDMVEIAKKIEGYLASVNKDISVAIMGCIVNGPGEAKQADLGVAGGIKEAILFKKGKIVRRIAQDEIYEVLINEIDNF